MGYAFAKLIDCITNAFSKSITSIKCILYLNNSTFKKNVFIFCRYRDLPLMHNSEAAETKEWFPHRTISGGLFLYFSIQIVFYYVTRHLIFIYENIMPY